MTVSALIDNRRSADLMTPILPLDAEGGAGILRYLGELPFGSADGNEAGAVGAGKGDIA